LNDLDAAKGASRPAAAFRRSPQGTGTPRLMCGFLKLATFRALGHSLGVMAYLLDFIREPQPKALGPGKGGDTDA
jgi:hypothetical protein